MWFGGVSAVDCGVGGTEWGIGGGSVVEYSVIKGGGGEYGLVVIVLFIVVDVMKVSHR